MRQLADRYKWDPDHAAQALTRVFVDEHLSALSASLLRLPSRSCASSRFIERDVKSDSRVLVRFFKGLDTFHTPGPHFISLADPAGPAQQQAAAEAQPLPFSLRKRKAMLMAAEREESHEESSDGDPFGREFERVDVRGRSLRCAGVPLTPSAADCAGSARDSPPLPRGGRGGRLVGEDGARVQRRHDSRPQGGSHRDAPYGRQQAGHYGDVAQQHREALSGLTARSSTRQNTRRPGRARLRVSRQAIR